jgi:hypothetical protein
MLAAHSPPQKGLTCCWVLCCSVVSSGHLLLGHSKVWVGLVICLGAGSIGLLLTIQVGGGGGRQQQMHGQQMRCKPTGCHTATTTVYKQRNVLKMHATLVGTYQDQDQPCHQPD